MKNKAKTKVTEYKDTFKFRQWCKYFYDKSNRETYGNAAKSALKAYNVTSYHSACQIGHENLRKLDFLKLAMAEQEGIGLADFIRIAIAKAMEGDYNDWEKLGIQLGYFDNPSKPVILQQQNNFDMRDLGRAIAADAKARGLPI